MTYADKKQAAQEISFEALPLFPLTAERIKEYGNNPFTMYSYDALAKRVIEGIALQLFNDGCSEKQIKDILASKLIRWQLDARESDLVNLGMQWAKDANWKNDFKEETK